MTDNIRKFDRTDVTGEACAWIAQIETGDMTHEDYTAFREWMQRSPSHVAEIKRLARLSSELNVLTQMAGPLEDAVAQFREIVARPRAPIRRRAAVLVFIAAILAALAAGAVANRVLSEKNRPPTIIATAVGDYREAPLPDGSTVHLNSDSRIEVAFNRERRAVRLIQGEGHFTVRRDPARAFVVTAGDNVVTAVGTAFAVRLYKAGDDFEVTVTEGRVAVASAVDATRAAPATSPPQAGARPLAAPLRDAARDPEPGNEAQVVVLKAGQNIRVTSLAREAPITEMTDRELQRKLSWQEGLFDFSNTPLVDVVDEISRHTDIRFEIVDPELSRLKFGGVFRTGEIDALLNALETSFDVDVEHVGDRRVRLSLRREP
ncbi:MAG: FecR domain-containing protein [Parvularculaceae bacterium]